MERQDSVSVVEESLAPSDTVDSSSANPRKRKKSSRACDFCHINHQPCDNAKPKCSYCERHGKSCLYLRPQKKRGPAQGYRSALHTMRESAAAWGAALNLIPSLGPVIEGYLKKSDEGQRLIRAIKDPQQQEFFIQAWQQSSVFNTFFGEDGAGGDEAVAGGSGSASGAGMHNSSSSNSKTAAEVEDDLASLLVDPSLVGAEPPSSHPRTHASCMPPMNPLSLPSHEAASLLKLDPKFESMLHQHPPTQTPSSLDTSKQPLANHTTDVGGYGAPLSLSLTDIVARDAARSSNTFSQTLGPLGFAPDETLNDFLALSYNPDPIEDTVEYDPSLGSEMDQKAYYELLMGKQFT